MHILALLLLSGCASYPERLEGVAYRVITASPEQVDSHCRKHLLAVGATHDDGSPIGPEAIRACTIWKRKGDGFVPYVVMSKLWRVCGKHEACHALGLHPPDECARLYPCLGEKL